MAIAMRKIEIVQDDWLRCYRKNWLGILPPAAFAHPAKVAFGLSERIYQHVIECGFAKAGDSVIDPFGGVAGFALHAMLAGLHYTGVELEEKFVLLGNQSLDAWRARYSRMPRFGSARLVQGDSRELAKVVERAGLCVSSPPYASQPTKNGGELTGWKTNKRIGASQNCNEGYGKTPGQLGSMKEDDFTLAISSPPFVESLASDEPEKRGGLFRDEKRRTDKTLTATYGESDGQLGAMKEGAGFQAAITSPPYEACPARNNQTFDDTRLSEAKRRGVTAARATWGANGGGSTSDRYNTANPGNLGNSQGDSFWSASRLILEQLHSVLSPDAKAIFVLKDFIRNKKRVPFCEQWAAMCEAVGFKLIHIHRSWLIDHHGEQREMGGEVKSIETHRKSFFRRLHESKYPNLSIDYETVMCFSKAGSGLLTDQPRTAGA
jgi:hypothetical protein